MQPLISAVTSDWLHLLIATAVVVLSLAFAYFILFRGAKLWFSLRRTVKSLGAVNSDDQAGLKRRLAQAFAGTALAGHWREYQDTLHEQRRPVGIEDEVAAIRATVPAENFFNAELIVDGSLHTEFFKHLPGILTGLGIIATFSGLITGLREFDVTAVDPNALKNSLGGLFGHVWSAFLLSAVAIGLAMFATIAEKLVYAANLNQVANIAACLDAMFTAGVGEEYLSKLVKSSEEGATQTKQLKESLVEDLKSLLTNLTERQIAATQQLSIDIGTRLETSLEAPLQKIAETVKVASAGQSESAGRMIENLMTAFMSQMRDTMGGQMGELAALMRASTESMAQAQSSLRELVNDMRQASGQSTEGVQNAISGLMAALAEHEQDRGRSMADAQVRILSEISQATQAMAEAQKAAAGEVNRAASDAARDIGAAAAESRRVSDAAAARATELSQQVHETTLDAIAKLDSGASSLAGTLARFESALERLAQSQTLLGQLHETGMQLMSKVESASRALEGSSGALTASTQSMALTAARVEAVAGAMVNEADARESALREVQLALSRSQEASQSFAQYSEQVTSQMEDAFERFGDGTVSVLERTLTNFDKELTSAVTLLGDVLERLAQYAADKDE